MGIRKPDNYPPNLIAAMIIPHFVPLVLLLSKASAAWNLSWNQDSSNDTTSTFTTNNQSTTTEQQPHKSNNASNKFFSSLFGGNSDMGCRLETPDGVKNQREARGEPLVILVDIEVRGIIYLGEFHI